MDLRDDVHTQLEEHIKTLRVIAKQETPPVPLAWDGIRLYLEEAAMHLETFTLPKVEPVPPYLDLRTGTLGNAHKIAEYVGATSETARDEDDAPSFLRNGNGAVKA